MLDDKDFKKMADLLRGGATMLNKACPECNSPLFKVKNEEIFCPICEKKVVIVKKGDEVQEILKDAIVLDKKLEENALEIEKNNEDLFLKLESVLKNKLKLIIEKLEQEDQLENLRIYSIIILNILKLLEKIKLRSHE